MATDLIQEIARELNYPGATQIFKELKARGVAVSLEHVKKVVAGQEERQVMRREIVWPRGKVVGLRPNERWDIDGIDYSAEPSSDGSKHILVAQDVFSRRVFAEAMPSKKKEAQAAALGFMFSEYGVPERITGDLEFDEGPVRALLEKRGVAWVPQEPKDYNATATLGKAIQELRSALRRRQLAEKTDNWAALLPGVVRGLNRLRREPLLDQKAEDVWAGKDKSVEFHLRKEAAQDLEENEERMEERGAKLLEAGGFRVREGEQRRGFKRSYKPGWSGKVYKVEKVEGAMVIDTEGGRHDTRLVQPVAAESKEVEIPDSYRRGSAAVNATRAKRLERFVNDVTTWLQARGGQAQVSVFSSWAKKTLTELDFREGAAKVLRRMGFRVWNVGPTYWVGLPAQD